jgi:DNA-binding beta-propeller fold protein YncE
VINAIDGTVLGTIDLGGMPEQAVTDGKGHVYVDIRDRNNVAVIDANTMTASAHYDLGGKGGRCSGLAIDLKNHILFAACREPQTMVMLNASDGKIIDALPIGSGVDSAIFNPKTMETYSAQVDGTLTIVKEKSPTSFVVEQTVETKPSAKQMVWDSKTNRILLVAADYGSAPAPATAGGPAGRGPMVPDSFSVLVVSK